MWSYGKVTDKDDSCQYCTVQVKVVKCSGAGDGDGGNGADGNSSVG